MTGLHQSILVDIINYNFFYNILCLGYFDKSVLILPCDLFQLSIHDRAERQSRLLLFSPGWSRWLLTAGTLSCNCKTKQEYNFNKAFHGKKAEVERTHVVHHHLLVDVGCWSP